jgi:hypothetical protein
MARFHIKTALGLVGLSLLAACGQLPTAPRETKQEENPKAVPTHVSQALAVNAAALHRTISPQSVEGEYVVSTEVYDPEGNLAYLANVIAPGPYTFEEALTKLPETAEVYLTGAVTDRPFHSETFTVKAIKNLKAQCPSCKLVYFNQALYGVEGENWYAQEGLLPTEEVQKIKETFAVLKKSIEESDIPEKMAEAWKKLIEGSPPPSESVSTQSLRGIRPMNLAREFFKDASSQVSPQKITESNDCASRYLWWCTSKKYAGEVSRSYKDYGNWQRIRSDIGWHLNPVPDLNDPLNAPNKSNPNNAWGTFDLNPITPDIWTSEQYPGGEFVVGCAMSVVRLLDWMRQAGELGPTVTLKLPKDDLSWSGKTVSISQYDSSQKFLQMAFWPTKIGYKDNRTIYTPWLTRRFNGRHFLGGTFAKSSDVLNGANAWLRDNGLPWRLDGTWLRDLDPLALKHFVPIVNWVVWSQNTWRVNEILKGSIGHDDRPAIILYATDVRLNLFPILPRIGGAHYGLSQRFEVIEYWDWSANWAYVRTDQEIGDLLYWNGSQKVFLSDYWDLTFGAYRMVRY